MVPMIDHIHITVEDIDRSERFYDKLLPLLEFDLSLKEYDAVPENEYRIVNQREAYKTEKMNRRKTGRFSIIPIRLSDKADTCRFIK